MVRSKDSSERKRVVVHKKREEQGRTEQRSAKVVGLQTETERESTKWECSEMDRGQKGCGQRWIMLTG